MNKQSKLGLINNFYKGDELSSKNISFNKWLLLTDLIANDLSFDDLEKYVNNLTRTNKEHNYLKNSFGHSFVHTKNYSPYLYFGYVFSKSTINIGDYLISEASNGKVAKFLVVDVCSAKNPNDMYWVFYINDVYVEDKSQIQNLIKQANLNSYDKQAH